MSPDPLMRSPLGDPCSRRGADGFTLIEVIVAVALAALALVALFQVGSTGLLTVNRARLVEEAVNRAQSRLAVVTGTGAIVPGESEGDDGDGYHWRLIARPIAMQPAPSADQAGGSLALYDVDVVISWGEGRRRPSVELQTERIAALGAPR